MKLDYIPSDEELQELLNAGISFEEEILDNGYLSVNWTAPMRRDWQRTLHLVKNSIPKLGRKYDPETKCWIIAPDYIPLFEKIKATLQSSDDDYDSLDSDMEDEILLNIMGTEFRKLPASMRQKALYVFNLYLQGYNGDQESSKRLFYCVSEDTWAAYHPEHNNWWYTSGSYSGYSPQEKDQRAFQNAMKALDRKAKALTSDLSYLDTDSIYLPSLKDVFRKEMLTKYEYRCYTCGRQPSEISKLHMHRIVPGKDGGEYVASNVVILCSKCHRPFEGESWKTIQIAHSNLEQG